MIRSFADADTEKFFHRDRVKRFQSIEQSGRKMLLLLHRSASLRDLAATPSARLEKMPEFGRDTYSIRVNEKYRILFRWEDDGAYDVRVTNHYR